MGTNTDTLCVGIDPSLTCTAMVCLPGGEPETWSLKRGDRVGRCKQYAVWAKRVYQENVLRIGARNVVIVIERPGGQLRGNAAWLLVLYAFILDELLGHGDIYPVAPSTLKKFATGKGNCEKSMVGQAVERHWGDELPSDLLGNDAMDAFALAKMAQCIANPGSGDWTAYQRACVAKLERYVVEDVA